MSTFDAFLLKDASRFDALAAEWLPLEAASSLPTQHFIFNQAAAHVFAAPDALRVLGLRRQQRLAAVAPFCRAKSVVPRWELLGAMELFEPADVLCQDAEAADALADALAASGQPMLLPRVPVDAMILPALRRAMRGRGLLVIQASSPAPTLALGPAWLEPESQFNSGRRSDFRRAQRQAEKFGNIEYEVLTPTLDQLDGLLDEAIGVELNSWKRERGTALGVDPEREAFFRTFARGACEKGILRLAFMRVDAKAIGMQIAVQSNNRYWLFKIGHDDAYSKCSPGTLLMLHTLRYAASQGLAAYEMLGSPEPWIATLWTKEETDCVRVRTYPFGARGLLTFVADGTTGMLNQLKSYPSRLGLKTGLQRIFSFRTNTTA